MLDSQPKSHMPVSTPTCQDNLFDTLAASLPTLFLCNRIRVAPIWITTELHRCLGRHTWCWGWEVGALWADIPVILHPRWHNGWGVVWIPGGWTMSRAFRLGNLSVRLSEDGGCWGQNEESADRLNSLLPSSSPAGPSSNHPKYLESRPWIRSRTHGNVRTVFSRH